MLKFCFSFRFFNHNMQKKTIPTGKKNFFVLKIFLRLSEHSVLLAVTGYPYFSLLMVDMHI